MVPNNDPRSAKVEDLLIKNVNKGWNSLFVNYASGWIFYGIPSIKELKPKNGIDKSKAIAHISSVINSHELKHDDRVYQSAHLLSIWFEEI